MRLSWPFHSVRQQIVDEPFPDEWLAILEARVRLYALLHPDEQERLRGDLRIFMAEKNWEGALDFALQDEVKVTISALASLLTVGFPKHDYFPNVQTIIVYPHSYVAPSMSAYGGFAEPTVEARLGEAHGNGPIILSWSDVVAGSRRENGGHNLVLHEFAHKLDFRDGDANGVPLLRDAQEIAEWAQTMSAEYDQLVESVHRHRHTLLQPYGATNPAEFFAVCTECFFEKSAELLAQKPALYGILKDYYGIDWAARLGEGQASENAE